MAGFSWKHEPKEYGIASKRATAIEFNVAPIEIVRGDGSTLAATLWQGAPKPLQSVGAGSEAEVVPTAAGDELAKERERTNLGQCAKRMAEAWTHSHEPIAMFSVQTGQQLFQNVPSLEWHQRAAPASVQTPAQTPLRGLFKHTRDYDAMMACCVRERKVFRAEVRQPSTVDSIQAWCKMTATLANDPVTDEECVIVARLDISALKQAERKLGHENSSLQKQVRSLTLELHEFQASGGSGDDSDEERHAEGIRTTLDSMVGHGNMRPLLRSALDDDRDLAHLAQEKIRVLMEKASKVLPHTAKELRQSMRTGGESARQKWRVTQRIAAATNGLEVANRWMMRLSNLTSDEDRYHPELAADDVTVFLGGCCGKTTWRQGVAMPFLVDQGIRFYNPQVDDWTPDLVEIEAKAKEQAGMLLFVISDATRALVSVLEAVEYICRGRLVTVVLKDVEPPTDFEGDGSECRPNELLDLNRLRAYLRDVAVRHGVDLYSDLREALVDMAQLIKASQTTRRCSTSPRPDA